MRKAKAKAGKAASQEHSEDAVRYGSGRSTGSEQHGHGAT